MNTLEDIRQRLVDSELLSSPEADTELQAWREASGDVAAVDGEYFLDWLIGRERITEFQGDAIAAGYAGPFRLGPYEVFEQIAPGLLGGMFRAIHRDFQQPVTLKVFPSSLQHDPEKLARMGREVRIFSELDHPHVLRSFQVGQVGDVVYIALEELHGETLAHRLEREGRLPFEQACRIMCDVALGLEHLHQNDVLHRDLQPAYIWVTTSGRAKVMEFGAARDAFAAIDGPDGALHLTVDNGLLGNYTYAAPELIMDTQLADARSDLYSLGCVLYQALAGQPPFEDRNPVRLALKHATAPVPLVSEAWDDVPAPLDETLQWLLAKRPEDRFQTAHEVAYALEQYVPAAAEHVDVVHVSNQYLEWVQATTPTEHKQVQQTSEGITPQLTEFLSWMSRRKKRRER